jgi:hypothetical protein
MLSFEELRSVFHGIAVANGLLDLLPLRRCQGFGVLVDRPEVESGAVASEVAGVCRRVRPFSLEQRQAAAEGIERERRMHVQITEQDLLGVFGADVLGIAALARGAFGDQRRRQGCARDHAGILPTAENPAPDGSDEDADERGKEDHCWQQATKHWVGGTL